MHHFVQLLCDALHFLVLHHVYRFRAVWWRPMAVPPFMWRNAPVSVSLLVAVWEESAAFLSALECCIAMFKSRASLSFRLNLFTESNEPVPVWMIRSRIRLSSSRVNSPTHKNRVFFRRLNRIEREKWADRTFVLEWLWVKGKLL